MSHPLNSIFNKVFLISIKRNQKRLETFIRNNPDIEIDIFHGVDGKELYPSLENVANFPMDFFLNYNLSYKRCSTLNKGQLGCAMSNLNVQKEIIRQKLQSVLILEDDAQLIPGWRMEDFNCAMNELPANWDLVYLGFKPLSKWSENPLLRQLLRLKYFLKPISIDGMSSADKRKRFLPLSYSRHLNIPGIYAGTHAYALSYEGAKKIVNIDTPLQYGFDTTLMYANYNKLINGFSLKKPLFIQNDGFESSLIN